MRYIFILVQCFLSETRVKLKNDRQAIHAGTLPGHGGAVPGMWADSTHRKHRKRRNTERGIRNWTWKEASYIRKLGLKALRSKKVVMYKFPLFKMFRWAARQDKVPYKWQVVKRERTQTAVHFICSVSVKMKEVTSVANVIDRLLTEGVWQYKILSCWQFLKIHPVQY